MDGMNELIVEQENATATFRRSTQEAELEIRNVSRELCRVRLHTKYEAILREILDKILS